MDVLQAIALFLGCAVILLVITVIWLILRYNSLYGDYLDAQSRQLQTQDTNKDLLHERFLDAQTIETLKQRTEKPKVQEIEPDEQPELTYEAPEPQEYSKSRLPDAHTNTYRCEDYRLFARGTEQYKIQQIAFTEPETGLRYVIIGGERYYTVALASAYGITLGNAWRVTLRNGSQFNILHGDYKHPIMQARADDFGDADVNYDEQDTISVIEFIYDEQAMPRKAKLAGTASYFEKFGGMYGDGGDIVKIEYLGRKWKP